MTKKTVITQPSEEAEKAQREIAKNAKSVVEVRGRKFKVGAIYNDTLEWITDIMQEEKNQKKANVKCFAALYLNGFFMLRLFYWLVWPFFYYVRQYTDEEMMPVVMEIKKKVTTQLALFYLNTTSLTDIRTTTMSMTREEAELFRRELGSGSRGQQPSQRKEG